MSKVMSALSLDNDLSLLPDNYYNIHMGKSPLEALIPMHMKFLWTLQLLFKSPKSAKNASNLHPPHSKHWTLMGLIILSLCVKFIVAMIVWSIWNHQIWHEYHAIPFAWMCMSQVEMWEVMKMKKIGWVGNEQPPMFNQT